MQEYVCSFEFEGLRVDSSIVEQKAINDGGHAFLIQSICCGRTQTNWLSNYVGGEKSLPPIITGAQKNFAKQFARELRGISAPVPPADVGLRFLNEETSKWSCLFICGRDLDLNLTLVKPEVINALHFRPSGNMHLITDRAEKTFEIEGYRAKIKYGELEFEQEIGMLEFGDGPLCIVGQDMVSLMRGRGAKSYYNFVDHHISRLHRDALKGRGNSILLIGSFGNGERAKLGYLQELLFERGYRGLLLDEFPDAQEQSLDQKMMFLASLCRFVICLDASAAGHYLELSLCARFNLVTAVLTSEENQGKLTTAMLYDLGLRNKYLGTFACSDNNISSVLDEALAWSLTAVESKAKDYDAIYASWRTQSRGDSKDV